MRWPDSNNVPFWASRLAPVRPGVSKEQYDEEMERQMEWGLDHTPVPIRVPIPGRLPVPVPR